MRSRPQTTQVRDVVAIRLTSEGLAEVRAVTPEGTARQSATWHVPTAVPGDHLAILPRRTRKRRHLAFIEHIISPSPDRIEPRCRHFLGDGADKPGCGGCRLQAISYDRQLAFKRDRIVAAFRQVGLTHYHVSSPRAQRQPWYYRNKMEFSFARRADGSMALGLHPVGNAYDVLALEDCYLLSPESTVFVREIRRWCDQLGLEPFFHARSTGFLRTLTIREGKRSQERMIELTTSDEDPVQTKNGMVPAKQLMYRYGELVRQTAAQIDTPITSIYWTVQHAVRGKPTRFIEHVLSGAPVLHEELRLSSRTLRFEIHPRAFFQPNTHQAEQLYDTVVREALHSGKAPSRVLDLYCGTGTIALALADHCDHVTGIELQPDAVENAQKNAKLNGIRNVCFRVGDAATVLRDLKADGLDKFELAVVDPPRMGLNAQAITQLHQSGADQIVYVSCNPDSLARDVRALARYGFRGETVHPIDMFPHTYHIESVISLVR